MAIFNNIDATTLYCTTQRSCGLRVNECLKGIINAARFCVPASRADEEQLPASAEQVRERRAGVGGGGRGARRVRWRWYGCGSGRRRQEGRTAAEGDALVGAHRRAAGARLPACAAALRDGAAPRRALATARRVTPPLPPISRLHSIIGTIGLAAPARASRSIIDSIFIYLGRGAARPRGCVCRCIALSGVRPCSLRRRRRVER